MKIQMHIDKEKFCVSLLHIMCLNKTVSSWAIDETDFKVICILP